MYCRYLYRGYYLEERRFIQAYKEVSKIARQIFAGFVLFLLATYVICLKHYDAFLDSLPLGIAFNIMISPLYYQLFGDEREFKFKTM